jgi:hypothetical protein
MASATKAARPKPTGIQAGGVSTVEGFCGGMGWGRKAFVAARRRGLPVRKASRRLYIVNDEAIAWLTNQTAKQS